MSKRAHGLGDFAVLSDELLLEFLHGLDPSTLVRLSCVSKVFYCYASHGELWRAIVLGGPEIRTPAWRYLQSWKQTYVASVTEKERDGVATKTCIITPACLGFDSEALSRPLLCSALDVDEGWLGVENIDRRSNLTLEEFRTEYEDRNIPVIITDVVQNWEAYGSWSMDYLRRAFQGSPVIVGDAPMAFDAYMSYCEQQRDEAPLYMFDKDFCDKAPAMAREFEVPTYFQEDLFSVLGKDDRPDYRWLIYGPAKSGSTFHKDPNATSAWNAVLFGSKKWIMYPPHVMPPGVRQSDDGADVSCPVSLMEWMLSFYDLRDCEGVAPRECVLKRGELLFVPRSWWHCAINLEDTLAITQNYVSRANLRYVLNFLQSPHADVLVSGVTDDACATLGDRFVEALEREGHGELLRDVKRQEQEVTEKRKSSAVLAGCFGGREGKKTRAAEAARGEGPMGSTAFSFGFL